MKPKAIILDLDGTLLNSSKKISLRNLNAIQAIRQKNIIIIFATARPPRVVQFDDFDLFSFGGVVFYNGALFRCDVSNQDIHFSITNDLVQELIKFCLSLDPESNISIEVKDQWFSFKSLDYTEMMKVKINPEIIKLEELLSYDCTKVLITDIDYSEQLIGKFNDKLNILVTDGGHLVQIMSNAASKENAVRYLVSSAGVDMKDVLCFGDDFNDLGLFQSCGYSIAMGNAIKELKEIASETTETNDKDGVAIILERIVSSFER
ncbi:Cof subfamily protein (haloacid dehalogenase superfamily) [Paenibacillus anaericanus]|nr:HAD family hydrolase [Paenibacillus anaericanus]MDQ0088596.1 Cof subfamily protein (haloacid dehalogenase superfamily) [Paenibacillus anaericanus]